MIRPDSTVTASLLHVTNGTATATVAVDGQPLGHVRLREDACRWYGIRDAGPDWADPAVLAALCAVPASDAPYLLARLEYAVTRAVDAASIAAAPSNIFRNDPIEGSQA